MTYREGLYNLAIIVAKAKENGKVNPDKVDSSEGTAWRDIAVAVEKETNHVLDSDKEEFLKTRMELAASFGNFGMMLQCPFKLKSGIELTEEDLKAFAQEHNLDFNPNYIIAGTVWKNLSFEKKNISNGVKNKFGK